MIQNEHRLFKFPKFADLIIHEDDNLIVINKPPFVASLDEREGGEVNILRLAKKYYDDAQVCHRLDKDTSGILLIAKNPDTYRSVSIEFEKRRVSKIYHAIIGGIHTFENLKVDLPILNQGNKNVSIDRTNGKAAVTIFNTLQYFKNYTLVECRPITGRMHQIRIHLATQHAAIVGDLMYKGKPIYLSQIKKRGFTISKDQDEQPIIRRFALHSKAVEFVLDGKKYAFEAQYPKDFATLLKQLEKFDS
ncbi:RNA pseudouridine synthase [Sphingobacterium alkalisoli]|uniref:RNA pseudouridine synthase n=1 Tax=Sphingobacterium alkalisoli TaxID=1874115 RepID=A0A4U0H1Y6_9SPHI|nr:RNA pseudouridine synthase [Sphingobacterium alkalisoli]TJY65595.1 RNA pseudouridine synthase [Sphingobacterium alkalisoli]GGH19507.1 RNA pseudouridine synthase [Sphingobacterium alkalisoli]